MGHPISFNTTAYILNIGYNKNNKTSGLENQIPWMACGAPQQISAALFWQVAPKTNDDYKLPFS